jgi:negative regulator of sigma E activity
MSHETQREALSALMDGELPPAEAARLLDAMNHDPELRELWRRHHQLSGLLSGHAQMVVDGGALANRIRESLDREPVVLAPRRRAAGVTWTTGRALALAASVALVAVVVALGLTGERAASPAPAPLAQAPSANAPGTLPAVVLAGGQPSALQTTPEPAASTRLTWNDARPGVEARLNGYLMNHNEYLSGGVRGMLPYARVVGYDPRN